MRAIVAVPVAGLLLGGCGDVIEAQRQDTTVAYQTLREDEIINADIWDEKPRILAAGLGFTSIIGVPNLSTDNLSLSRTLTHLAGGAWNTVSCAPGQTPSLVNYTSASTPEGVANGFGQEVFFSDGLPIEFSWPLLPSTLDASDFQVNLNNGQAVTPQAASIYPNMEFNERSVAVIFGHFGNRVSPDQPGAIYPTSIEVVSDDTPLQLVGPGAQVVSAVGLTADAPGSPYTDPDVAPDKRGGPKLVGAKLTRMSTEGDTAPKSFQQALPNDGAALYGDQAQYRLRTYTSGGMTADGVRGVFPTDFARFFRLQATTADGATVLLTETGKDYVLDGKTVRVVGLADLGKAQDAYDDCYLEDKDNYIDIILSGDIEAVSKITNVEIPSTEEYSPLYNPGGPGNDPAPNVRYSAPSPPIVQKVTVALDDPMTVTYPGDASAP
jgi:hypothetical protein